MVWTRLEHSMINYSFGTDLMAELGTYITLLPLRAFYGTSRWCSRPSV